MAALEQHSPGLLKALSATTTTGMPLRGDQIGVAYWAAASWGALISLLKTTPTPWPICLLPCGWFCVHRVT